MRTKYIFIHSSSQKTYIPWTIAQKPVVGCVWTKWENKPEKRRHGIQDLGNPIQRKVKAFPKVKVKGKDFSDDSYALGRQPVENEAVWLQTQICWGTFVLYTLIPDNIWVVCPQSISVLSLHGPCADEVLALSCVPCYLDNQTCISHHRRILLWTTTESWRLALVSKPRSRK